ncbi:hypothetical protein PNIG_a1484 [Pseudoalteromonas nigrifaciens]|uniref:Uncharacterized protein n=1 Tax=Pseudoalteromonas nigrifaciens TaxID=28109 RepID=A0AAC9UHV5_9GAMM|nr:hypothetical protein PNIG_a1484 [Pseudoalteromonas nigrifaciens]
MIAAKGLQIAQVKSRHHYALTDTLLLTERVIKRIVRHSSYSPISAVA